MINRILLIVDPQNDFVTGSLAVPGAKEKMENLAKFLETVARRDTLCYNYVCVTMDSHPKDHCSFKENGGTWPEHCVIYTEGWDPCEPLKEYSRQRIKGCPVINHYHKGTNHNKEEYSIFDNNDDGKVLENQIAELMDQGSVYIDVCGIAGDYCVLETIKGLRRIIGDRYISVLTQFIASIDGGEKLMNYIKENNLNYK